MIKEHKKYICTDLKDNHNKLWEYELNDDDSVIVRWGRVGKTLQTKSFLGGKNFVEKKVSEKLEKGYREVQSLNTVSPIKIGNNSLKELAKKQIATCLITQSLIEKLVAQNSHDIFEASGGRIQFNTQNQQFTTAIGVITLDSIKQARKILDNIAPFIKDRNINDRKLFKYIEDYLVLVPQDVGMKLTVEKFLPDLNAVQQQNALLDGLEVSYNNAIKDNSTTETEEKILFKVKLELVKDRKTIDWIENYYRKTQNSIHSCYGLKVDKIFSINMEQMKEDFEEKGKQLGTIKDLWHGTRTANLLSILKNGFVLPPSGSPHCTGRLFGDGFYFSSQSTKSLNYSYGYWGGGRRSNCFMLLNKVALGRYEVPPYGKQHPSKGYDSFWAQPHRSGVMNDEMIVFKRYQINPEFLIEFNK